MLAVQSHSSCRTAFWAKLAAPRTVARSRRLSSCDSYLFANVLCSLKHKSLQCYSNGLQSGDIVASSAPIVPPFHIAFPVRNVEEARAFYGGLLGCPEGRSAKTWVDFNLYGHQIVAHLVKDYNAASSANQVDGDPVPVPHFGVALSVQQFHELAQRLKDNGVEFVIQPHLRFQGQPGEQWTMFFKDPSGNSLEFKAMTTPANLFAKYFVSS